MNVATVKQAIHTRRANMIRKKAGSPEPLIPLDIRWALIKRAAQLRSAKLAGYSKEWRQMAVLSVIRDGLSGQKTASHEPKMLLAELECCRKIGEFLKYREVKTASIAQMLSRLLQRKAMGGAMASMKKTMLPAAAGGLAGAAGGLYAGTSMMPPRLQLQTVPNGPDWSESLDAAMKSIRDEMHRRQVLTANQLSSSGDPMQKVKTISSLLSAMKTSSAPDETELQDSTGMDKEAFIGALGRFGMSRLGAGLGSGLLGAGLGSGLLGAGLMGRKQISDTGSAIGGRMTNAYNALFNPSAVQTPQQMANIGIGGKPPAVAPGRPQAPAVNPYEMDFNTMTMADFMKHRQTLQQRLGQMDQAYPGFAPQQPTFSVAPPGGGKPLTYNPNGNIPRYYGMG